MIDRPTLYVWFSCDLWFTFVVFTDTAAWNWALFNIAYIWWFVLKFTQLFLFLKGKRYTVNVDTFTDVFEIITDLQATVLIWTYCRTPLSVSKTFTFFGRQFDESFWHNSFCMILYHRWTYCCPDNSARTLCVQVLGPVGSACARSLPSPSENIIQVIKLRRSLLPIPHLRLIASLYQRLMSILC